MKIFCVMVNNGVKIAAIIQHFCTSQKEFADRLGVSIAVVSNWKKRGVESVSTLQSIVDAYPAFNPAYLFDANASIEKQAAASIGPFSSNGNGAQVSNNDTAVVNRFLSIIEEKDKQIAQLIAKL